MAPKNTALSIKEKLSLISEAKKKEKTRNQLAAEFKCDISTVNRIIRNETKIRKIADSNKNVNLKRYRQSNYKDVEKAITIWFNQVRLDNAIVSSQIIMNKAKEFAIKLNSNFEPSRGWLWRWQRRENIKFARVHGESNESDSVGARNYLESGNFASILQNYSPENIFNADESGLFYKVLPNGTLTRKGDSMKGIKAQKHRLTLLFLCNSIGTYKKVYAIGKYRNPRCFKNNKSLPVQYFSNQNAWMTAPLWNSILEQFNNEMSKQNRKIVLFVDNASCHKVTTELEYINVQFLPPNTTALIQPLDQGIIHSFKSHFRQIMVRKQIVAIERGLKIQDFTKSITILDALYYIKRAWWLVKESTIINCFRKGGFSTHEHVEVIEGNFTDMGMSEHNFNELVTCDDNIPCYGVLTDTQILEGLLNENGDSSSEDEAVAEESVVPNFKEALAAINVLRLYTNNQPFETDEIENLETKILNGKLSNMSQSKITEYFK